MFPSTACAVQYCHRSLALSFNQCRNAFHACRVASENPGSSLPALLQAAFRCEERTNDARQLEAEYGVTPSIEKGSTPHLTYGSALASELFGQIAAEKRHRVDGVVLQTMIQGYLRANDAGRAASILNSAKSYRVTDMTPLYLPLLDWYLDPDSDPASRSSKRTARRSSAAKIAFKWFSRMKTDAKSDPPCCDTALRMHALSSAAGRQDFIDNIEAYLAQLPADQKALRTRSNFLPSAWRQACAAALTGASRPPHARHRSPASHGGACHRSRTTRSHRGSASPHWDLRAIERLWSLLNATHPHNSPYLAALMTYSLQKSVQHARYGRTNLQLNTRRGGSIRLMHTYPHIKPSMHHPMIDISISRHWFANVDTVYGCCGYVAYVCTHREPLPDFS